MIIRAECNPKALRLGACGSAFPRRTGMCAPVGSALRFDVGGDGSTFSIIQRRRVVRETLARVPAITHSSNERLLNIQRFLPRSRRRAGRIDGTESAASRSPAGVPDDGVVAGRALSLHEATPTPPRPPSHRHTLVHRAKSNSSAEIDEFLKIRLSRRALSSPSLAGLSRAGGFAGKFGAALRMAGN